MIKTKPLEIIASFSPEELKEMSAFIRSPYFNSNKNLVKLYDVIKKELKKILAGKLSEEDAFKAVFPGKEFNYGIMKNLVSGLAAVCEEFLIVNAFRTKPQLRIKNAVILCDEYDTRGLDRHFDKSMQRISSELNSQLIDNNHYADRAMAEESIYFFNSSRSDEKALEKAIYNEIIYNLCDFYRKFSRSMWKIDINVANINSAYDIDFIRLLSEKIDFEGLAAHLKNIDRKAYDFIMLNTLLIKLLVNPEQTVFFAELKQLLRDTIDNYENYERFSIFSKVVSYCSTIFRRGHYEFINEALQVRTMMMDKVKFNYEGLGPLNFHHFTETVLMHCIENGPDAAEEFLNRYIHTVSEDRQEICRSLSMAYIHEARGENDKAIDCLVKTPHADTDIKSWVKRLYIMIYFNTGEFEAGFDAINAFKSFTGSNSAIPDGIKRRYIDFARIMEKMLKIKCSPEQYTAADAEELYQEVMQNNHILRSWQLEKIKGLKELLS